ncbi:hypothetical protein N7492_008167 [Penicillium capsulatum]|uniref:Cell wall protein n=1 Tax=Penicillium capsulatum TaxID=69766 RepID=A0A9W9HS26_9EURO|nr:hypothetical protein N7492_008167 [Penicillium capsulatum]KAJ6105577.1 hypothetical protein N7512_009094 [Penicillium capsulatum]
MAVIKTLLVGSILSIAATAAKTSCPTGWLPNTFHETKCCSGDMVVDEEGAYCCVRDMRDYKEALTNTAKLYETATTTGDSDMSWTTADAQSCVAKVRYTATDYSAQVSSASKKAEANPTGTSTSEVTSTTSASTGSSSGTASQTPSPTSNAALPLATGQEAVLGGAALAAALFVL